jgi:hypothetical protein
MKKRHAHSTQCSDETSLHFFTKTHSEFLLIYIQMEASYPIPSDPFNESVYALIPEVIIPPPKEERYRSKFASTFYIFPIILDQARVEYNQNRKSAASMGPAKVVVNDPSDFLKCGAKEAKPSIIYIKL